MNNRRYSLSTNQAKYLRDKIETGKHRSSIEEEVEKKCQLLIPRLQEFIDDVALLYEAGYLDADDSQLDWTQIHQLTHTPNSVMERQLFREDSTIDGEKRIQDVEQIETVDEFGHLVGSLFHMLMAAAPNERPWGEFLRGIALFYATVPDGPPLGRIQKLRQISTFDSVDYRGTIDDDTKGRWGVGSQSKYTYYALHAEILSSLDSKVQEVLREQGIKPNSSVIKKLRDEADLVYEEAGVLDISGYKSEVQLELDALIDETLLEEIDYLHKSIQKDIALLRKRWRGPDRDKVVMFAYQMDGQITSQKIASTFHETAATNLVTTAIKQMSDQSETSDLKTEYHLFQKDGQAWKFTPYGTLCALSLGNRQSIEESLYTYGISGGDIEGNYSDLIAKVLAHTEVLEK